MAKYVLIPDSFKGTLSSEEICRIASEEILRLEPEAEICAIPVAAARPPRWARSFWMRRDGRSCLPAGR